MSDQSLGQAYRDSAQPRGACPPAESLAALAHGHSEGEGRRSVLTHVARCQDCAEALRLAMAVTGELDATSSEAPLEADPQPSPRWRRLAAAASLLIVVGVASWFFRGDAPTPPAQDVTQFRGETPTAAELPWPQDGAKLETPPTRLEWPGSTSRLELFTVDGISLYRQEEATSPHELPATIVAGFEPGGAYIWVLESLDGERLTLRFTVDP